MQPHSMKSPCGQALSCKNCAHPCSLRITGQKEQFSAETVPAPDIKNAENKLYEVSKTTDNNTCGNAKQSRKKYSIGIDLGTTTLAFALYNSKNNRVEATHTSMNPQRCCGADVVSRIKAAENPAVLKEMQSAIKSSLAEGIFALLSAANTQPESLSEIAIAGNTVMSHILMGYDPSGLGSFPFKPYSLDLHYSTWQEIFKDCPPPSDKENGRKESGEIQKKLSDIPVLIFPCSSAYIGGDIVSGLYSIKDRKNIVLIDLGTNGEMAISSENGTYCASASAGPAFEGGNITCGTGSIPGAIHHVSLENGKLNLKTIENKEPAGICGSGIISLLSLLLENGYMDENGLLIEPYFSSGFRLTDNIIFYQKDIREIQLAKSAVRTGLSILLKYAGLSAGKINTFYLSGSFGSQINLDCAVNIGLLPKSAPYSFLGNSSLKGTLAYLKDPNPAKEKQHRLSETALEMKEILLSKQEDFETLYYENMAFPQITGSS